VLIITANSNIHRWIKLLLRIIAAIVGGYGLGVNLSIILAAAVTSSVAESALAAMLMSFACFIIVALWVFHQKSIGKIYIGLIAAIALTGCLAWFLVV
jgi:hypothetical protein